MTRETRRPDPAPGFPRSSPIGCLVGGRDPARSSTPGDAAEPNEVREELRAVQVGDARGWRSRSGVEPQVRGLRGVAGVGLPEAVSASLVRGAPGRLRWGFRGRAARSPVTVSHSLAAVLVERWACGRWLAVS